LIFVRIFCEDICEMHGRAVASETTMVYGRILFHWREVQVVRLLAQDNNNMSVIVGETQATATRSK